ncbi:DUF3307 domain-containing protein [Streptomyces caniscabiei]|uniref:DUF3307 domain-containing protein n=1 Tax=Streptomyces caniscabiei TaxID=2746961 RepID=A0A927L3K2_9ACTN|nr:DUF3307 domain-containing protein [Streptomyces caniscabiei]MBD9721958.1 DUF3307 domain-containing protein [Streptomyces caniscabiei]MDX3509150.1 DUF3307 domain-containing protein [Streptomyces caniscabiei]MDX3717097.1 DUF3307 domain-containing protein [Streptomyces caniscabiei]WEO22965.1 DUF3307 domain-containing protein [Streptomyces caniscabiei]
MTFAPCFILLYVAHLLADYPLQTDHQAEHKDDQSTAGWKANLAHAGTHFLASATLLAVGAAILDLNIGWTAAAAGLIWIGATHSLIDRRWPIQWWMRHTKQPQFAEHGGAAHVDQTAHITAIAIAAFGIAAA